MKIQEQYIAIKRQNMPVADLREIYALIARVTNGTYADAVTLELCEDDGFDGYEVADRDGRILIRASTGVGLAAAFNAYLKERCGYSIGALATSGTLPATPPPVGTPITRKSRFLYRYFFNYCTFSYTYAFDTWEEWERTLDYLVLSGYNLILNPVGLESVWRRTLLTLGYREREVDRFLCGPAFYAWQWMMNMTGWAGGAPAHWYEEREQLAGKINCRLHALGAATVAPAYAGMVPPDFAERFPDATVIPQGEWCGFVRPSLLLPEGSAFDRIADIFYTESRRIPGADGTHYYSVDPFHEGGSTEGIDLPSYGERIFAKMTAFDEKAVWMLQGWTSSPKPPMMERIPTGRIIVTNLSADRNCAENMYGGAPWCACSVFCYGGQTIMQGSAEAFLEGPHRALENEHINMIGIGYMPEGVNCNELYFEMMAYNAFAERGDLEEFVSYYVSTKYGTHSERIRHSLLRVCREVLNGKLEASGESALCARPTLTVENTSFWSRHPNPYMDQSVLTEHVAALLSEYGQLADSRAFCRDLLEAARQIVSNLSWYFVDRIKRAFAEKDSEALSQNGSELLTLFDLQTAIVSCDGDMLLGTWLEKAKRHGRTPAEQAYFEWNARVQITLWANREGAVRLRDYAAREWQGLLEDFYRPRWESFLSRLEIALLTDTPLEEIRHYDEELPFVYRKKAYPTRPTGEIGAAAEAALRHVLGVEVTPRAEVGDRATLEENVMKAGAV